MDNGISKSFISIFHQIPTWKRYKRHEQEKVLRISLLFDITLPRLQLNQRIIHINTLLADFFL